MEEPKANPKSHRLFYFWAGIIATLAYRIIIILNFYSTTWVKISWYIGTIGFVIYFIHRYEISSKRAKLIVEHGLIEKVERIGDIDRDDQKALGYILKTLVSTKEKWNYIAIFALSGIALVLGILFDFVLEL